MGIHVHGTFVDMPARLFCTK